jgi:hypothetical protein
MHAPSDCNRFEACVHVECSQHGADVVADGLGAELELVRDLFGRTAVLEQAQHLALAGRQLRLRRRGFVLFYVDSLAEDADHPPAAAERDSADLDR